MNDGFRLHTDVLRTRTVTISVLTRSSTTISSVTCSLVPRLRFRRGHAVRMDNGVLGIVVCVVVHEHEQLLPRLVMKLTSRVSEDIR